MNASLPPATPPSESETLAAPSDAELIARCCGGDLASFDDLVGRHQDRIYNLCYWMLGNRDEAADAAQDAFVRAFRSLSNFRGDSSFGTWLHRIAVNAAIDTGQRRKRAPLLYSDLAWPDQHNESGGLEKIEAQNSAGQSTRERDEPGQIALRRERREAVRDALARLPEHYRMVIVLFDIEGHSYDEIATTLQLPLGTVKSRINRARAQLRDELGRSRELFDA